MTEGEDFALVRECIRGNPKAFECILDKYQKKLFNVALRLVGNRDDAEDITQSAFVKAYENLDTFKPKYKFFSWIYRILINESLNFLSQRNRLQKLDESLVTEEKTPEQIYDENVLNRTVQDALMKLTVEQRAVLILRHFHDLSYREMGYVLDLPEKTVKSRLHEARRSLRSILPSKTP